jgi:hypothetical protein
LRLLGNVEVGLVDRDKVDLLDRAEVGLQDSAEVLLMMGLGQSLRLELKKKTVQGLWLEFGLDLPNGVNLSGLIGSVLPGVADYWLEDSSAADKMTVQLEPPELPQQLDAAVQENHQIEQASSAASCCGPAEGG